MDAQLAHYANKLAYEIDSWDLCRSPSRPARTSS